MTPRYHKLRGHLAATHHWSWFPVSKNRLARRARRALKRATRREVKRHGLTLIEEGLNDRG